MTDREICEALAMAIGWTQQADSVWRKPTSYVRVFAAGDGPTTVRILQLGDRFWNPLKSLDDMAEVEACLIARDMESEYGVLLFEAVRARPIPGCSWFEHGIWAESADLCSVATAPARIRALAACRVLGIETGGESDAAKA